MTETPNTDKPLVGIGSMLIAAFFLATMNMIAKLISDMHDPVELTFYRNIIALALLLSFLVITKRLSVVKTTRPKAHLLRALVGTVGIVTAFWAYSIMPLADATALIFTSPLFVILLSTILLKEKAGPYRISAALFGFLGVVIIAGPSGSIGLFETSIGLLASFSAACVAICLRWLGSTEDAVTTVFYFLSIGLIVTGLAMPFIAQPISGNAIYLIPILGTIGLLSLLFKTFSYKHAPANLATPVTYSVLVWAVLFDVIIWEKWPSAEVLIGSFIIVGSNLFILWREQRLNNA